MPNEFGRGALNNTFFTPFQEVILSRILTLAMFVANIASVPAFAIVNGNAVTVAEQQQKALVTLNNGACSGVLITNDWALTAGHCVDTNRLTPGNIRVTLNGTTITGQAVYLFGGFADEVGPDLALLHLSAPFNIAGSTTSFRNQLWNGNPHGLFGKTIAFYGQGQTGCTGAATGGGTYLAADFVIDSGDYVAAARPNNPTTPPPSTNFSKAVGGPFFKISRTSRGQIPRPGDSGGASFIFENGTPMLVGIQSGGSCNNPPPGVGPAGQGTAYQNSLSALRLWIDDVFKSKWTPGAQSQPVFVYSDEVSGTKWNTSDVNAAHWAQAARAAAAMCFNRGFAGGHFDGHQGPLPPIPGNGYGLQCSGGDTQWFDVTTADMDRQWRFGGDINTVNWAQAGRTAERICATKGFVGGQFNGHQRNGRYGIFCYRGGAQWFDATDPELAATGWGFPTPRLDDNLWAQAARAATGFCRGKGFSGGFMNGHQVPGHYGVVCQK